MFSQAFTDLSHSFPISGRKYWFENGRDITPLIKLQFFLCTLLQLEITHFPSTALLFYPERHFHICIKGELKPRELYFFIIIILFIKQMCGCHSVFCWWGSGSSEYAWLFPHHYDKVLSTYNFLWSWWKPRTIGPSRTRHLRPFEPNSASSYTTSKILYNWKCKWKHILASSLAYTIVTSNVLQLKCPSSLLLLNKSHGCLIQCTVFIGCGCLE